MSTNELRANLSEIVGRAAFGSGPVLIERRGRKVAAIVSIEDLQFLERMRGRRDEVVAEELPKDQSQVGAAIAERLRRELFFG